MVLRNMSTVSEFNDAFRRSGCGFVLTPGVRALQHWGGLIDMIRTVEPFNEDNDPYNEHDFGKVIWCGQSFFWKIDYYNHTMTLTHPHFQPS